VENTPHYDLRLSEAALALREVNSLRKMNGEERARRVEELRRAIRDGTYRVDSFRVAESILREEEPYLFS
jgi:flagellar biosynthesis anti-sigma factor FlgM